MSRRNLLLILASLVVTLAMAARVERNPKTRHVAYGFQLIDGLALDEPPDDELVAGAMRGMIGVLRRRGDTHSAYMEPQLAEPLRDEMRQQFGGVGVMIRVIDKPPGGLMVVEPPEPGGPAYTAGIQGGDRIVAIDGEPTEGITLTGALEQLRGPVGKPVDLEIARKSDEADDEAAGGYELISIAITRRVIRLPALRGDRRLTDGSWEYRLEEDPTLAHVRLAIFGNRTVEELRDRLAGLQAEGVTGLILDVRDNAGGALDAAVGVTDLFLPKGAPVVSTRGRGGRVLSEYVAESPNEFEELQMAVLIDRDTASAAEIVAAALADNGRATLFGERSYGKGTVQQLLPVEAGRSLLKLTTASYWRPSGVNIHRLEGAPADEPWGVWPAEDQSIPLTNEELEAFRVWRRQRDLLPAAEGVANSTATNGEAAKLLESDRVLAAAVRWLTDADSAP